MTAVPLPTDVMAAPRLQRRFGVFVNVLARVIVQRGTLKDVDVTETEAAAL